MDEFAVFARDPTWTGRFLTVIVVPLLLCLALIGQLVLNRDESRVVNTVDISTGCEPFLFTCNARGGCTIALASNSGGWALPGLQDQTRRVNLHLFANQSSYFVPYGNSIDVWLCPSFFEFLDFSRNDVFITSEWAVGRSQSASALCEACGSIGKVVSIFPGLPSQSSTYSSTGGGSPARFVYWDGEGGFIVTSADITNASRSVTVAMASETAVAAIITVADQTCGAPNVAVVDPVNHHFQWALNLDSGFLSKFGLLPCTVVVAGLQRESSSGANLAVVGASGGNPSLVAACEVELATRSIGRCDTLAAPELVASYSSPPQTVSGAIDSGLAYAAFSGNNGWLLLSVSSNASTFSIMHHFGQNRPPSCSGPISTTLSFNQDANMVVLITHCTNIVIIAGLDADTLEERWQTSISGLPGHVFGSATSLDNITQWWTEGIAHVIRSKDGGGQTSSFAFPSAQVEAGLQAFSATAPPTGGDVHLVAFSLWGSRSEVGVDARLGNFGTLLTALPTGGRVGTPLGTLAFHDSILQVPPQGTILSSQYSIVLHEPSDGPETANIVSPESAPFDLIPCSAASSGFPCLRLSLSTTVRKTTVIEPFSPLQIVSNIGAIHGLLHVLFAFCISRLCLPTNAKTHTVSSELEVALTA